MMVMFSSVILCRRPTDGDFHGGEQPQIAQRGAQRRAHKLTKFNAGFNAYSSSCFAIFLDDVGLMKKSSAGDVNKGQQLQGLQGLPAELLDAVLSHLDASSQLPVFRTSKLLATALLRMCPRIQLTYPTQHDIIGQHLRELAPFLTEVLRNRQQPKLHLTLQPASSLTDAIEQSEEAEPAAVAVDAARLVAWMLGAVPLCGAVDSLTISWCKDLDLPWEPVYSAALASSFPSLTSLTLEKCIVSIDHLAKAISHPLLSPRLLHLDLKRVGITHEGQPGRSPFIGSRLQELRLHDVVDVDEEPEFLLGLLPLPPTLTQLEVKGPYGYNWDWVRVAAAVSSLAQLQQLALFDEYKEFDSQNPDFMALLSALAHLPSLHTLQISDDVVGQEQLDALLALTQVTSLELFRFTGLTSSRASAACSWRQLEVHEMDWVTAAHLPLHSLTHPLELHELESDSKEPSIEVLAAAELNLCESNKAGLEVEDMWLSQATVDLLTEQYLSHSRPAAQQPTHPTVASSSSHSGPSTSLASSSIMQGGQQGGPAAAGSQALMQRLGHCVKELHISLPKHDELSSDNQHTLAVLFPSAHVTSGGRATQYGAMTGTALLPLPPSPPTPAGVPALGHQQSGAESSGGHGSAGGRGSSQGLGQACSNVTADQVTQRSTAAGRRPKRGTQPGPGPVPEAEAAAEDVTGGGSKAAAAAAEAGSLYGVRGGEDGVGDEDGSCGAALLNPGPSAGAGAGVRVGPATGAVTAAESGAANGAGAGAGRRSAVGMAPAAWEAVHAALAVLHQHQVAPEELQAALGARGQSAGSLQQPSAAAWPQAPALASKTTPAATVAVAGVSAQAMSAATGQGASGQPPGPDAAVTGAGPGSREVASRPAPSPAASLGQPCIPPLQAPAVATLPRTGTDCQRPSHNLLRSPEACSIPSIAALRAVLADLQTPARLARPVQDGAAAAAAEPGALGTLSKVTAPAAPAGRQASPFLARALAAEPLRLNPLVAAGSAAADPRSLSFNRGSPPSSAASATRRTADELQGWRATAPPPPPSTAAREAVDRGCGVGGTPHPGIESHLNQNGELDRGQDQGLATTASAVGPAELLPGDRRQAHPSRPGHTLDPAPSPSLDPGLCQGPAPGHWPGPGHQRHPSLCSMPSSSSLATVSTTTPSLAHSLSLAHSIAAAAGSLKALETERLLQLLEADVAWFDDMLADGRPLATPAAAAAAGGPPPASPRPGTPAFPATQAGAPARQAAGQPQQPQLGQMGGEAAGGGDGGGSRLQRSTNTSSPNTSAAPHLITAPAAPATTYASASAADQAVRGPSAAAAQAQTQTQTQAHRLRRSHSPSGVHTRSLSSGGWVSRSQGMAQGLPQGGSGHKRSCRGASSGDVLLSSTRAEGLSPCTASSAAAALAAAVLVRGSGVPVDMRGSWPTARAALQQPLPQQRQQQQGILQQHQQHLSQQQQQLAVPASGLRLQAWAPAPGPGSPLPAPGQAVEVEFSHSSLGSSSQQSSGSSSSSRGGRHVSLGGSEVSSRGRGSSSTVYTKTSGPPPPQPVTKPKSLSAQQPVSQAPSQRASGHRLSPSPAAAAPADVGAAGPASTYMTTWLKKTAGLSHKQQELLLAALASRAKDRQAALLSSQATAHHPDQTAPSELARPASTKAALPAQTPGSQMQDSSANHASLPSRLSQADRDNSRTERHRRLATRASEVTAAQPQPSNRQRSLAAAFQAERQPAPQSPLRRSLPTSDLVAALSHAQCAAGYTSYSVAPTAISVIEPRASSALPAGQQARCAPPTLPRQERRERSDAAARSNSEQRKREYVPQHQERLAAQMTALQSVIQPAISEDWQHHALASGATRLEDSPLKALQVMQVEYISMQDRLKLTHPCYECASFNQSISPNPSPRPSSAGLAARPTLKRAFLEALNAAHHPALYPPHQIRTDSFSQAFFDYLRAIDRILAMPSLNAQTYRPNSPEEHSVTVPSVRSSQATRDLEQHTDTYLDRSGLEGAVQQLHDRFLRGPYKQRMAAAKLKCMELETAHGVHALEKEKHHGSAEGESPLIARGLKVEQLTNDVHELMLQRDRMGQSDKDPCAASNAIKAKLKTARQLLREAALYQALGSGEDAAAVSMTAEQLQAMVRGEPAPWAEASTATPYGKLLHICRAIGIGLMKRSSAGDVNKGKQLQRLPAELLDAVLSQLDASSRLPVFRTSKLLATALLRMCPRIQLTYPTQHDIIGQHLRELAPFLTEVLRNRQQPKLHLTLQPVRSLTDAVWDTDEARMVAWMLGAVPLCGAVDSLTISWCKDLDLPWEPVYSAALASSFPSLTSLTLEQCRISIDHLAKAISHPLLLPRLLHLKLELVIITHEGQLGRSPFIGSRLQELRLHDVVDVDEEPEFLPGLLPLPPTLTQLEVKGTHGYHWDWVRVAAAVSSLTQLQQLTLFDEDKEFDSQKPDFMALLSALAHLPSLHTLEMNEQVVGQEQLDALLALTQITCLSIMKFSGLTSSRASAACSWRQLEVQWMDWDSAAYLPLHSLTHPLHLFLLVGSLQAIEKPSIELLAAAELNLCERNKAGLVLDRELLLSKATVDLLTEQYLTHSRPTAQQPPHPTVASSSSHSGPSTSLASNSSPEGHIMPGGPGSTTGEGFLQGVPAAGGQALMQRLGRYQHQQHLSQPQQQLAVPASGLRLLAWAPAPGPGSPLPAPGQAVEVEFSHNSLGSSSQQSSGSSSSSRGGRQVSLVGSEVSSRGRGSSSTVYTKASGPPPPQPVTKPKSLPAQQPVSQAPSQRASGHRLLPSPAAAAPADVGVAGPASNYMTTWLKKTAGLSHKQQELLLAALASRAKDRQAALLSSQATAHHPDQAAPPELARPASTKAALPAQTSGSQMQDSSANHASLPSRLSQAARDNSRTERHRRLATRASEATAAQPQPSNRQRSLAAAFQAERQPASQSPLRRSLPTSDLVAALSHAQCAAGYTSYSVAPTAISVIEPRASSALPADQQARCAAREAQCLAGEAPASSHTAFATSHRIHAPRLSERSKRKGLMKRSSAGDVNKGQQLQGLPEELLDAVLSHLAASSRLQVFRTSKLLATTLLRVVPRIQLTYPTQHDIIGQHLRELAPFLTEVLRNRQQPKLHLTLQPASCHTDAIEQSEEAEPAAAPVDAARLVAWMLGAVPLCGAVDSLAISGRRDLDLPWEPVYSAALASSFPSLTSLTLEQCIVSIDHLAKAISHPLLLPRLLHLDLKRVGITREGQPGRSPFIGSRLQELCLHDVADLDEEPEFLPGLLPLPPTLTQLEVKGTHGYHWDWVRVAAAVSSLAQLQQLALFDEETEYNGSRPDFMALLSALAHLPSLHTLQISDDVVGQEQLDALLALTQITCLSIMKFSGLTSSRASAACSWRQLEVQWMDWDSAAYLPLHSLTHPLHLLLLVGSLQAIEEPSIELLAAAELNLCERNKAGLVLDRELLLSMATVDLLTEQYLSHSSRTAQQPTHPTVPSSSHSGPSTSLASSSSPEGHITPEGPGSSIGQAAPADVGAAGPASNYMTTWLKKTAGLSHKQQELLLAALASRAKDRQAALLSSQATAHHPDQAAPPELARPASTKAALPAQTSGSQMQDSSANLASLPSRLSQAARDNSRTERRRGLTTRASEATAAQPQPFNRQRNLAAAFQAERLYSSSCFAICLDDVGLMKKSSAGDVNKGQQLQGLQGLPAELLDAVLSQLDAHSRLPVFMTSKLLATALLRVVPRIQLTYPTQHDIIGQHLRELAPFLTEVLQNRQQPKLHLTLQPASSLTDAIEQSEEAEPAVPAVDAARLVAWMLGAVPLCGAVDSLAISGRKDLDLPWEPVYSAALASSFPSLTSLTLEKCIISIDHLDKAISHPLLLPRLLHLDLKRVGITREGQPGRSPFIGSRLQELCLHDVVDLDEEPEFLYGLLPLPPTLTQLEVKGTHGYHWDWVRVAAAVSSLAQLQQLALFDEETEYNGSRPDFMALLSALAHLPSLHTLQISDDVVGQEQLDALLALTQITCLSIMKFSGLTSSRASAACSWRQLEVQWMDWDSAAYLPLHSLTHPLHLLLLVGSLQAIEEPSIELLAAAELNLCERNKAGLVLDRELLLSMATVDLLTEQYLSHSSRTAQQPTHPTVASSSSHSGPSTSLASSSPEGHITPEGPGSSIGQAAPADVGAAGPASNYMTTWLKKTAGLSHKQQELLLAALASRAKDRQAALLSSQATAHHPDQAAPPELARPASTKAALPAQTSGSQMQDSSANLASLPSRLSQAARDNSRTERRRGLTTRASEATAAQPQPFNRQRNLAAAFQAERLSLSLGLAGASALQPQRKKRLMKKSSAGDVNKGKQLQGLPAELLDAVLSQLDASSRLPVFMTSKLLATALLRMCPRIQLTYPTQHDIIGEHLRELAPFLTEVLRNRQQPKLHLTLQPVRSLTDAVWDTDEARMVAWMLGAVPLCGAVDSLTISWLERLDLPWEPVYSAALASSFPSLTSLTLEQCRISIDHLAKAISHPLLLPRLLHLKLELVIITHEGQLGRSPFIGSRLLELCLHDVIDVDEEPEFLPGLLPLPPTLTQLEVKGTYGDEWDWVRVAAALSSLTQLQQLRLFDEDIDSLHGRPDFMALLSALAHLPSLHTLEMNEQAVGQEQLDALLALTQITSLELA
ncbi:hypothetical protein QJQ45_027097 [Haematococcus lacustris]|nr:hypothetical protein QJQ45_027097 [Haematococcus lacustris]